MVLQKTGKITYNGESFDEFHVKRTSAYISQTDNHIAELTVRETLDFAARCQGANEGFAGFFICFFFLPLYNENLFKFQMSSNVSCLHIIGIMKDLTRLEKEKSVRPSSEIDVFMKVRFLYIST